MKQNKLKSIYFRVEEKEKKIIENYAKKCGLSLSEYLRQRALKYQPKAILPETFYNFSTKLDTLLEHFEGKQIEDTIIKLMDDITDTLILPNKEAN
jgi:hypothetical protein